MRMIYATRLAYVFDHPLTGPDYDQDFIAYPRAAWRVDVPVEEYRLDRPR